MTPAQPDAQVPYQTRIQCAATPYRPDAKCRGMHVGSDGAMHNGTSGLWARATGFPQQGTGGRMLDLAWMPLPW